MDSLLFALNAVMPIVGMVAIGYILRRMNFMTAEFAKLANKIVFRILLPAMLFLNVYHIESLGNMEFGYIIYVVIMVFATFALSLPAVIALTKENSRRGVLLQAAFRSNYALIGIPLAQSLFGDSGVAIATLLSAVTIPVFNILAVICMTVFSNGEEKPSVKKVLLGIVTNPLIVSVLVGVAVLGIRMAFVEWSIDFRLSDIGPLYKVLSYLSNMATPLALLVLGAQFEFSAIAELKKEIVFGTAMRTVITPVLGLGIAYLFFREQFNGAHFATFVAVFSTPLAVSTVPMAQEMGADSALAGQLVVWSTLLSAASVFLASFLLKAGGVF